MTSASGQILFSASPTPAGSKAQGLDVCGTEHGHEPSEAPVLNRSLGSAPLAERPLPAKEIGQRQANLLPQRVRRTPAAGRYLARHGHHAHHSIAFPSKPTGVYMSRLDFV